MKFLIFIYDMFPIRYVTEARGNASSVAAPKIQCDYGQFEQIAGAFAQHADDTAQLMRQVVQHVESLQSSGWVGVGANNFYREMFGEVLPGVQRLMVALRQANTSSHQIARLFRDAEQEAANLFGGSAGDAESRSSGDNSAASAAGGDSVMGEGALGPGGGVSSGSLVGDFIGWLFGNKYFKPGGAIPTSHWERNSAYDEIVLSVKGLPGEAGNVKFFQAAERVTSVQMLGGTSFAPDFVISDSTADFSNKVGEDLYLFNRGQAEALHRDPYNLYDPNGTGRRMASALEYDVNYVHAEQSRVESFIRSEMSAGRINRDNITELSDAINGDSPTSTARDLFYKGVSPVADTGAAEWAKSLLGGRLDFSNQAHREAIGKATVFQAHGLSQAQYETYMRTGKLP